MGFVWNILLSFDNEEWWEDGEDQPRETCKPLERINDRIPGGKLVAGHVLPLSSDLGPPSRRQIRRSHSPRLTAGLEWEGPRKAGTEFPENGAVGASDPPSGIE